LQINTEKQVKNAQNKEESGKQKRIFRTAQRENGEAQLHVTT